MKKKISKLKDAERYSTQSSPVSDVAREKKFQGALAKVSAKHARTLSKLAKTGCQT